MSENYKVYVKRTNTGNLYIGFGKHNASISRTDKCWSLYPIFVLDRNKVHYANTNIHSRLLKLSGETISSTLCSYFYAKCLAGLITEKNIYTINDKNVADLLFKFFNSNTDLFSTEIVREFIIKKPVDNVVKENDKPVVVGEPIKIVDKEPLIEVKREPVKVVRNEIKLNRKLLLI